MNIAKREDDFFNRLATADKKLCLNLITKGYIVRPSQYWDCLYHYSEHKQLIPLLETAQA
ncbi:MAG: hypothetical protein OEU86_06245 [Gammaproteobacteria bacterium]|nr:hypothetical protein [Gammaproteobacteria bacterium]